MNNIRSNLSLSLPQSSLNLDGAIVSATESNQSGPMTVEHLKPDLFPTVITTLVLSYLEPDYLEKVSEVQGWEDLASNKVLWAAFDLRKLFPKLAIIDKTFWKDKVDLLKIDVSDEKPIEATEKREMIRVITKLLPLVEGNAGISLLTMPRGLTLNKLAIFAQSLTGSHGKIIRDTRQVFRNPKGNEVVDKTYRVVLTRNILGVSRNKYEDGVQKVVDNLGVGCELPMEIEMTTLLIATFIKSNTRLFGVKPWTYSYCQKNGFVGGFGPHGFDIGINLMCLKKGNRGVAGRKKF